MECEFCAKKYSNKSNLLLHQRTSNKCLLLQGKEVKNIKCDVCERQYVVLSFSKHVCKPQKKKREDE